MKYVKVIVVLVLIAMFSCIFIGCDKEKEEEEDKGISSGFTYRGGEFAPKLQLGFRAEQREFNIDDVRLEVGFGWIDFLNYDTNFDNLDYELIINQVKKGGKEVTIMDIPNFNSRQYACHIGENNMVEYSYLTEVKIPEELFEEEGMIGISIVNKETHMSPSHGFDVFKYTKIGENKIKISES